MVCPIRGAKADAEHGAIVIWDLEDDAEGNYVHIVIEHGVSQDEVWDVVGRGQSSELDRPERFQRTTGDLWVDSDRPLPDSRVGARRG
jgi:hypothetical protein